MSRGGFKVEKHSHDYGPGERVSWIDQFADKINNASQKTAVEVARDRSELSLHDQISSIVSGKSAHTVDSLVQEYHERTGLAEYLKRQSEKIIAPDKVASDQDVFSDFGPEMKNKILNFCKNKIATSHGQISVPAIQREIIISFKGDGVQAYDVETDKVAKFISDLIIDAQRHNPPSEYNSHRLGDGVGVLDVEDSNEENTDFYKGLMPYRGQGS